MPRRYFPMARGHIVTSGYGPRWGATHYGVDFGWPGGSANKPVYAVQAGTVVAVGWDPEGFGHYLDIDSDDAQGSNLWVYGHIVPEVRRGQKVDAGQRIGRVNGDRSTNGGVDPHVHVEVHRWTRQPAGPGRMDPMPFLKNANYPGTAPAPATTKTPTASVPSTTKGATVATAQDVQNELNGATSADTLTLYENMPNQFSDPKMRYWLRSVAAEMTYGEVADKTKDGGTGPTTMRGHVLRTAALARENNLLLRAIATHLQLDVNQILGS